MDIENNVDANDSQNLAVTTNQPTKIRFEYDDDEEAETIEEVATESSNLEEDSTMCEPEDSLVAGDDKTSADYYFDSYSHFGNYFLLRLLFPLKNGVFCVIFEVLL